MLRFPVCSRFLLLYFVITCCYFRFHFCRGANIPSAVFIGGIFDALDVPLRDELESSFWLAIDDINDKSDGVFDNILRQTKLFFTIEEHDPISFPSNSRTTPLLSGEKVVGVVNTLRDTSLASFGLSGLNNDVPTLTSSAVTSLLDSHLNFPLLASVNARETLEGNIMHNFLCQYANKIVVIDSSSDDYDFILNRFLDDSSSCNLNIIAKITVRSGQRDMGDVIRAGLQAGGRYFAIFLPPPQLASLLEMGYECGLFGENSVVTVPSRSAANLTNYFSSNANILHILTGFFTYEYYPDYYANRSNEAIMFAREWQQRLPSQVRTMCNQSLPWRNIDECLQSHLMPSSKSSFTGLVYDATILLALGIDFAIKHNLDYQNKAILYDIILSNVSFLGVSGEIGSLFHGNADYSWEGRGSRKSDLWYRVKGFNPQIYQSDNSTYLTLVQLYSTKQNGFVSCDDAGIAHCYPSIFGISSGGLNLVPPLDAPPPIVDPIDATYVNLIHAMTASVAMMLVVSLVFLWTHSTDEVVLSCEPVLLWCILLGSLVALARIVLGGVAKSDDVCMAEFWTGHIAFAVVVGSFYAKSRRMHSIVHTKSFAVSTQRSLFVLAFIVAFALVYLVIASLVGRSEMKELRWFHKDQDHIEQFCSFEYPEFQTALFAIEFFLVLVELKLCYDIRNVPDMADESKCVTIAMFAVSVVAAVFLPTVSLADITAATQEFITCIAFTSGSLIVLCMIFGTKLLHAREFYRFGSAKVNVVPMESSKKKYTPAGKCLLDEVQDIFRGKTYHERVQICKEMVDGWQAVLLNEQRCIISISTKHRARMSTHQVAEDIMREILELQSNRGGALVGAMSVGGTQSVDVHVQSAVMQTDSDGVVANVSTIDIKSKSVRVSSIPSTNMHHFASKDNAQKQRAVFDMPQSDDSNVKVTSRTSNTRSISDKKDLFQATIENLMVEEV